MRVLLKCSVTLLVAVTAAIFNGCSTAQPPQDQGRSGATPAIQAKTSQPAASPSEHAHHAPPTQPIAVIAPGKTADIISQTEMHFQQLAAAIQNKDARQAHQHDNAIRTLIGSIPARATEDAKRATEALADISEAVRAAHRLAHDDNWAEAADHVKHGQAALAKLKAELKESQ